MTPDRFTLQGSVAFVTGGGTGIGRGIALCLAGYGAAVVVSDVEPETLKLTVDAVNAAGGRGFAVVCDVSQWERAADALTQGVRLSGGPIDILVNSAGLYLSVPFHELSREDHERLYGVNVSGVFAMCQAAIPDMKARQRGKIVNIASVSGKDPFARSASYGSSKSAVIGMTKSLAKELGPHNINVNSVCPGLVYTKMQEEQCRRIAGETGRQPEDIWRQRLVAVPLGRAQEPSDIGEAVAFLVSDRARNITGQSLNVCGGQQMMD
jgi:NAD(P)-dependent dehydrogenase (short-subunit alcohol dehydrogenase family)